MRKQDNIDRLILKYMETGRVAFRNFKRKTISLNGGRHMQEGKAINHMKDTIKQD